MEWQIEQVLNRDQRTTKTMQPFDQDDVCLNCKKSQWEQPLRHNHAKRRTEAISSDGSSGMRALRNSSFTSNCHNQYFLKNARLLYQTEVPCECGGGVKYHPETNEMTPVRFKSWLKHFSNLLLFTYVSFLVLPCVRAVPTTLSSRSALVESTPMASQEDAALIKNLIPAHRATCSALGAAEELKTYYINLKSANVEEIYQKARLHGLPHYPLQKNMSEAELAELNEKLAGSTPKSAFSDVLDRIYIIQEAYNVIADNFENHAIKGSNRENNFDFKEKCNAMRGMLANIKDDLTEVLYEKSYSKPQVPSNVITVDMMNRMSETQRTDLDWMVLRSLVEVLSYTAMLFEHFQVPSK